MEARLNVMLDRTKFMKWTVLLLSLVTMSLVGCDNGTFYGESEPEPIVDPTIPVAARLVISTDSTTVSSDNSDSANITVLALDSSNGAVEGALIDLSTTAGTLTASSVVSDANGEAVVTFSAGADPSNQTATITASSGTDATPVSIPVDIVGSTVTITATANNVEIGGNDTTTLTIKAANSSGVGVYDTPVSVLIDTAASTGSANLSSAGGRTNTQGEFSVNLTGTSSGTVRVVATSLNITASFDVTINTVVGSLLISSPVTGSTAGIGATGAVVSVDVPAGTAAITLDTSLGNWSSATGTCSGTTCSWSGLSGPTTVTARLTSAAVGTASIQVEDDANLSLNDSILLYFVNQTVDANSVVSIQATPVIIAPSTIDTQGTSDLLATVTDAINGGVIAGARVSFKLSNATGSGEYVYPAVAYTDAFGIARATLYSGSQSTSGNGLTITSELDQTLTGTLKSDSVSVIVGGTAGSIAIGLSTKVSSINSDTAYSMPISLQVTDANGSAVPNTVVNLSLWPETYALGTWFCKPEPGLWIWSTSVNEDMNKNLSLDTSPSDEDVSGDLKLTPPNSSAGSIPSTVTTDENGIATFQLVYLKASAGFVYNALTASTIVQATETQATRRFWLGASESDISGCWLGESPFNTAWPVLDGLANPSVVAAGSTGFSGGSSTITATLKQNGIPLGGKSVTATIISDGTKDTVSPTIDGLAISIKSTDTVTGEVVFTYTAGDSKGNDWIKLTYDVPTPSGTMEIAKYILIAAE